MASKQVSVLILYRADGRILLQHRTNDAPTFPGYWAFFGGGIEVGESAEEAIRREILEELGYSLSSPSHFKTVKIIHQGNEHTLHVFVEKFTGGTLTLGEGQGMDWFLPGDVGTLKVNDHDRAILQAFGETLDDRLAGRA